LHKWGLGQSENAVLQTYIHNIYTQILAYIHK